MICEKRLFAAMALLLSPCIRAQPSRAPGNDTISKDQLRADLFYLAGDAMRGRLTGTHEYSLAAAFVASRFERMGLKAAGHDGTFFHRFDLVVSELAAGNRMVIHAGLPASRTLNLHEDFYPLIFSASAKARGKVVFAGYGIHAPGLGWSDYAGHPIRGNIALILDGDPGANDPKSPFDGLVTSEYANVLRKAMWAQEHGAAGVMVVGGGGSRGTDSFPAAARGYWPVKPPIISKYTLAAYARRIQIPAMQVSPALVGELLRAGGKSLAGLREQSEKGGGSATAALGGDVEIEAALTRSVVEDRSPVAMIEGADPEAKKEAILVSGHYDHNGATPEQIFNGADDNGSGTVALLEIAEAYALAAQQGQRPRRTVIFASWGSEERCCGPLLGAWAWVEDPLWPLEKTVAVLNMDMIGRSEDVPAGGGGRFNGLPLQTAAQNANNVHVMGYSFSPDLSAAVTEANRHLDLGLVRKYDNNRSNLLRRSDQWPFLQRSVPALFFHTGLHPDYHTQFDRPERIDYAKMERIARLVHQLSWNLAQSAARPKFSSPRVIPPPE